MTTFKRQANQLYQALKARNQTWSQSADTLSEWASEFSQLHNDVGKPKKIQNVLTWYCSEGCGTLFTPMVGNAKGFRERFDAIDSARQRSKGKTLIRFDDVVPYEILERKTGSQTQKECHRVLQRVRQQVEYVDNVANGRIQLPKLPTVGNSTNGQSKPSKCKPGLHSTNGQAKPSKLLAANNLTNGKSTLSPYLKQQMAKMTERQRTRLKQLLAVDREVMWQLLMANPYNQSRFHDRLEQSGWWRPFQKLDGIDDPPQVDPKELAMTQAVHRRHFLSAEPNTRYNYDPRRNTAEYGRGQAARKRGSGKHKNPFKQGTLGHELWNEGWMNKDALMKANAAKMAKRKRGVR